MIAPKQFQFLIDRDTPPVFIGWQETGVPEMPAFPLFNVGLATFAEQTLINEGITLPAFPSLEDWKTSR